MLELLWSLLVFAFDEVLSWIILVIGAIFMLVVNLLTAGMTVFLGWLPDAGAVSNSQVSGLWSQFSAANQYVPLDLAGTLLVAWGVLYGAVSLYKLWKAVPFV